MKYVPKNVHYCTKRDQQENNKMTRCAKIQETILKSFIMNM